MLSNTIKKYTISLLMAVSIVLAPLTSVKAASDIDLGANDTSNTKV